MPSFLSKVFARKKDEKDASHPHKRTSASSLLEGKFEAISPPASPSAMNLAHAQPSQHAQREKEKDTGFSLFRTKSPRPTSPRTDAPKPELPHLTLSLAEDKGKDARQLGAVFETDAVERGVLPDNVIGERRLSPHEALNLVKACSTAIADRGGLETLGVMHPHWYSASPDVQRKLISLFILSLASKSPSTLSASPTSPTTLFNTELQYTRSPHDLAAVLRWALRHVRLEGDFFGIGSSSSEPWKWYTSFSEAERAASYPSTAFSKFLTPQIPPAHSQLLLATLEIVSSLAAHSDYSGISGGKVAKLLGLWLLTARRTEENDDWSAFYTRWERAGRILEHLFLAQIRDDMTRTQMPKRLIEQVAGYPYLRDGIPQDDLLPRPRLSTRAFDALYVRLETKLPDFSVPMPKQSPLQVLADAVGAEGTTAAGEHAELWDLLKQQAAATEQPALSTEDNGFSILARAFTDETTSLLSKLPSVVPRAEPATIKLEIPEPRGRSRSVGAGKNSAVGNGTPRATASTTNLSPNDWVGFSSLGFGETTLGKDFASTLMDNDVEVTEPPLVRRKSSRRKASSPPRAPVDAPSSSRTVTVTPQTKCASVKIVQIDEAFIDFWSDALLDPISSNFPSFVVCQLKPIAGLDVNGKPLGWLVVEQVFTRPPPPPDPPTSPVLLQRTASPRPSLRSNISSRKSATFANAKKRFTLFSTKETITTLDSKLATRKKAGKTPKIGEMGEILVEEPETQQSVAEEQTPELPSKDPEPINVEATRGAAATADATDVNADLPPVPIVEADTTGVEAVVAAEPVKADDEDAEKPTKFVENITPPTNSSPASSAVIAPADDAESKDLPPTPKSVVLAGETPGPNVAINTSEPTALAEAFAHAEDAPVEEAPAEQAPLVAQPVVAEETQPVVEAVPQPLVAPQTHEPVVDVQAAPAEPELEPDVPPASASSAHVEATAEPPVLITAPEPEVLPTEEEPAVKWTPIAEGAVAEPTPVAVTTTENEPTAEPKSVEQTPEPEVVPSGLETVVSEQPVASAEEEIAAEQAAVTEESSILSPQEAEVIAAVHHVPLPSKEVTAEHAEEAADETENGLVHEEEAGVTASLDAA